MSGSPTWDAALRAELVGAAARAGRRRRRRPLQLAGASAAGLLALGALALRPGEAQAEIRVERSEAHVIVTLVELQEDPHAVERELRAEGFDVAVELVPAGPSAVGRFVGSMDTGGLPSDLVPLDGSGTSFAAFSLPLGWHGSLRLFVGRPAEPGEAYLGFSDALAPGEPLACLPIVGQRADAALAVVAGRADRVDVRRFDVPDSPPLSPAEVRAGFRGWVVRRADAIAPGHVVVWLLPPAADPMPTAGGPVACGP